MQSANNVVAEAQRLSSGTLCLRGEEKNEFLGIQHAPYLECYIIALLANVRTWSRAQSYTIKLPTTDRISLVILRLFIETNQSSSTSKIQRHTPLSRAISAYV